MEIIEGFRLLFLSPSRVRDAIVEVGPMLRTAECFEFGVVGILVIENEFVAGDSLLE